MVDVDSAMVDRSYDEVTNRRDVLYEMSEGQMIPSLKETYSSAVVLDPDGIFASVGAELPRYHWRNGVWRDVPQARTKLYGGLGV